MKKNGFWRNKLKYFRKILLVMRLILLLLITSTSLAFSISGYSQNTKLTLSLTDATVDEVIKAIEDQSEYIFLYRDRFIDLERKVSIDVEAQGIDMILDLIFDGTSNVYLVKNRQVIIGRRAIQSLVKKPEITKEPEIIVDQPLPREIKGNVTDASGNPLIGVTVIVKGTTTGTITNIEGDFTFLVPADAQILVISFMGMESQELVISDQNYYNVVLQEALFSMDELVVVGYGQQKKVTVTGSVSSVSSKQLVQSPVANISNALVGRATGVLAVQRSGAPGEDQSTIRIRGIGTFAGSQNPLILVDGIETESYDNIDPNEVENISILKDASSTAVYGVRGANGVILITTKRGVLGKPKLSYSANIAGSTLTGYREKMRAVNYTSLYNEALKYDSYISGTYNEFFTAEEIELYRNQTDPIFYPDVDWMDMLWKDMSFQNQHNFNIRGGTELVKYFVSMGLYEQEGQFNNTNVVKDYFDQQSVFSRYNFRSNFDFQITNRLSSKFNLATKVENKRGIDAANVNGLIRAVAIANPIRTPGIVDGKFVDVPQEKVTGNSPFINNMYSGHRKTYRNFVEGSFRFDYDMDFITKGLKAHSTIAFENFNMSYIAYNKPLERYDAVKDINNETVLLKGYEEGAFSTRTGNGKRRQSYYEAGLNYNRSFGEHDVTALVLYTQQKIFDPDFQYAIPKGYQGLVGRITYSFNNRYLLEYNAGYNGSEQYAQGLRFGYFPAYSVGWVLSEESFFPKNDLIAFVKFRASYGEVGNDKIGGDRFLYLPSTINYSDLAYTWGEIGVSSAEYGGAYEGKIGNPNLTWERAIKANAGFDVTFFKDKLRLTADVFQEKRDNILAVPQTVPVTSGMGTNLPAVNLGKVENKGWDGDLSFNNRSGQLNYWVRINYTYARNLVVYKDEIPNPYPYLMETGQPVGQQFGYIDAGLYNSWEETNEAYRPFYDFQNNRIQPGVINWRDINGDGVVDQYDQGPIAYTNFPENSYGMSFGFDFKNFDFSALFQGASKVSFMGNGSRYTFGWNNWNGNNNYLLNSWTQERYEQNLPIHFPHFNVAGGPSMMNRLDGTFYTKDASYIRLRNLEVGYRVDKLQLIKNLGIEYARFYFNGSNLWTFAYGMNKMYPGVDPEDLSEKDMPENTETYPRMAVFNFGINVNF